MSRIEQNATQARSPKDEQLSSIERVLQEHVLDNEDGNFRWTRDISSIDCIRYCLRFIQSASVFGFKVPCTNRITLQVNAEREPQEALFLTWEIESRNAQMLCQQVVKETDAEIRETIAALAQAEISGSWQEFRYSEGA